MFSMVCIKKIGEYDEKRNEWSKRNCRHDGSVYRANPPKTIDGKAVEKLLDYELQTGKNLETGENGKLNYQKAMCCNSY